VSLGFPVCSTLDSLAVMINLCGFEVDGLACSSSIFAETMAQWSLICVADSFYGYRFPASVARFENIMISFVQLSNCMNSL
jgi:hypothetical protein